MDFAPGTIVAGRYRVERKVGQGAWGEVWSADHITVGLKVALKTLRPSAIGDAEAVARFRREAYFLGRIRSDHVARVFDFFTDDRYGLVLVMDYIEGEPLSRVLKSPLSIEDAIELGCDLAAGVRDLHAAGIIHRDLKPANVILQPLESGHRAMIVDFSLSRLAANARPAEISLTDLTKSHMALGTLPYMAPEQVLNSRQVTEQSDLYAIGAILFRGIQGRHVFEETEGELAQKKLTADPPPVHLPRKDALARALETIMNRALKRRPAERYRTASQMLRDFRELRGVLRNETTAPPGRDEDDEHDTSVRVGPSVAAVAVGTGPSSSGPQSSGPRSVPPVSAGRAPSSSRPGSAAEPAGDEGDEDETRQRRAPSATSSSSRRIGSSAPRIVLVVFSGLSLLFLGIVAGSVLTERRLGAAAIATTVDPLELAPSAAPSAPVDMNAFPEGVDGATIMGFGDADVVIETELSSEDAAPDVLPRARTVARVAPPPPKDAAVSLPVRLPSSSDEPVSSELDGGEVP